MKKVFIKVVNGNHQECIDYLVSLGGKNLHAVVNPEADSYSIDPCGTIGWMDDYNWYIDEGYTEIFLPEAAPSKRHPHHDLIVQWVGDISQKVWKSHNGSAWTLCETPKWIAEDKYYIGETPPPSLEPVLFDDVCDDSECFVVDFSEDDFYKYAALNSLEKPLFDRKLVYSTPEGAINRAKEMLGMVD